MEINKDLAKKVLDTVDAGLCSGVGTPEPGKMCVEAAVNFAMGRPHGDEPSCVGSAVRRFKIELNDANWSSNAARASGMRKIAIAQLGSDQLDQTDFARRMAVENVKTVLPVLFRKLELEEAAKKCEEATDLPSAKSAAKSAEYAAKSAKSAAKSAKYAAKSAGYAAESAEYAAESAESAAKSAAKSAESAEYAEYAAKSAGYAGYDPDYFFKLSADVCLKVLIDMKSPGCEFLFLCDAE